MLATKDLQDIALHNIARIAALSKGQGDLSATVAKLEERLAQLEGRALNGRAQVLRLVK
jgi:hypothetical protein